jgi:putative oxidoreductase
MCGRAVRRKHQYFISFQMILEQGAHSMKVLILASRILLGAVFLFFGLNHIHVFLHAPMPAGDAGTLSGVMFMHHWFVFYGLVEAAAGLMLLVGLFVPLGLTLLAGVGVNILLFHITLEPSGLPLPVILTLLELLLVYAYRDSFAGLFRAKAAPKLT